MLLLGLDTPDLTGLITEVSESTNESTQNDGSMELSNEYGLVKLELRLKCGSSMVEFVFGKGLEISGSSRRYFLTNSSMAESESERLSDIFRYQN